MIKIFVFLLFISSIAHSRVNSFNGFPVRYMQTVNGTTVAVVGTGMLRAECFHDGVFYALILGGVSSCPGYFNVFPSFDKRAHSGSPACEETGIGHDPWL